MHLMQRQWTLRFKGFISSRRKRFIYCHFIARYRARTVFHAMEKSIVEDVHHEEISLLFMHQLNVEFNGQLNLAIQVFEGDHRKFMLQLISSQYGPNGLFKTRQLLFRCCGRKCQFD
jgi:hypothetical protein